MASTLLEQARSAHEDSERLERIVVADLQQEIRGHKERLYQNHRIKNFVESIIANNEKLIEIYEDNDGARKDEIAAIGGQTSTNQNVFSAFYDRLKEIRDYHRKHPNARIVENLENVDELIQDEPYVEFSGEEAFGRYLDLHEHFNTFLNSKFGKKIEYSLYLDEFRNTKDIPKHLKFTRSYRDYLSNLVNYLISFIRRTQPLQNNDKILKKLEDEFDEKWQKGEIPGWEKEEIDIKNNGFPTQNIIDVNQFDTVQELMDPDLVKPEQIKQALAMLGLKTGGTFEQRAARLLLTKNTPLHELDEKHFANKSIQRKLKNNLSEENEKKSSQISKEIALFETKLFRLCELLQEAISETKANVEKKHALTYEEIEAEREDHEGEAPEENSDDEEGQIYNPLKLPMGWDGKPIPYWLYKLHGLGQEFKCEICGNYSYWGRRAFERHFKEWRHQHGMRCLGIPNTKNFNEITVIKDAEALWEKIKEKQGMTRWKPEVEEEYEDSEGNVYNKKTYLDLQRQGLI